MLRMKSIVITTILAATCWLQTSEAQAGPLLDWLRGIRRTSNTQNGLFNQSSAAQSFACLLYTSPSPRDQRGSRMPSSA